MLCKDLMSYPIIFNYNTDSILDVSINMAKYKTNFLLILNKEHYIIGIITGSDIIKRIISKKVNISQPINNYITNSIIFCYEDQDISYAISKMADNQIKQIIIINKNNFLKGVISIKDIALKKETNKYLNDLLYELFSETYINPLKTFNTQKKI